MFSHIMVGSNDVARSKKFYDALFVAMGGKPGVEDAIGRLIYALVKKSNFTNPVAVFFCSAKTVGEMTGQ
jgi:hypothetical protein